MVDKEIWKVIEGFPNYEVSNLGNVRNKKTGHIRKLSTDVVVINQQHYTVKINQRP